MEDKRVPIQEALLYLWKLRNKIIQAEFELTKMVEKRNPIIKNHRTAMPPMIANDPDMDEEDEQYADYLFLDIQDHLQQFMGSYSGVVIPNDTVVGWNKPVLTKCKKAQKE